MASIYYVRCDELVELVSDYLEHALDPVDAEALEQHMARCAACADYLAQMRRTLCLAASLATDESLDEARLSPLLQLFRNTVA